MRTIYCISGLGADERIFKHLQIKNTVLKHLSWVDFDENETMETYAMKMAEQIAEKTPIILGLSFGGMLAVEIAKQKELTHTFLISSAKGKNELPDMSDILVFMIKSGIVPYSLFKQPNKILYQRFGATRQDEKEVLNAILKDTKTSYLRNAFRVILNWENTTIPNNITHIHGTHDRILQAEFITPDYWIKDGTHMMVWNRANEVAGIIEKTMQKSII